ncbi:MAG: GGDEF domain-containing protein [Thermoanaerobaculia bacterium]
MLRPANPRSGSGFDAIPARSRGPGFWTLATLGLALGLGALDYFAGSELGLSLVYVLPSAAAAWFAGFRRAAGVAVASVVVWLTVEILQGSAPRPMIAAVNTTRRLAVLLVASFGLARLRRRLDEETLSARTDFLTGIGNARSFYEDAGLELARASRYGRPFTVVYADLDDLKSINDRFGHYRGDAVLRNIADTMRQSLRSIDRVARMGGDEFALLLPETGLEAARSTLEKLRLALQASSAREGYPVTLTMGALVCLAPPRDVVHMIALADGLLLAGKREGKNTIRFSVHDTPGG